MSPARKTLWLALALPSGRCELGKGYPFLRSLSSAQGKSEHFEINLGDDLIRTISIHGYYRFHQKMQVEFLL